MSASSPLHNADARQWKDVGEDIVILKFEFLKSLALSEIPYVAAKTDTMELRKQTQPLPIMWIYYRQLTECACC